MLNLTTCARCDDCGKNDETRNAVDSHKQEPVRWATTGSRFALLFDDEAIAPILFAGDGAEQAAIQAYQCKSSTLQCRLFAEISLGAPDLPSSEPVRKGAAVITVHQNQKVRVEILNENQSVHDLRHFDRMTEARSWLSAKGFGGDRVTFKAEQICDRATHSTSYAGMFYCAICQDSCLEPVSTDAVPPQK